MEVHRGKVHQFLGMTLDFSVEGECKVQQFDHVSDMIESFSEEIGSKVSLTRASSHLYEKGEDLLLSEHQKVVYHSITAKGIFVSLRSRLDIIPTVSVLSGRVREPTTSDREKLKRLLKYLNGTLDLYLTLVQWFECSEVVFRFVFCLPS